MPAAPAIALGSISPDCLEGQGCTSVITRLACEHNTSWPFVGPTCAGRRAAVCSKNRLFVSLPPLTDSP